MLLRYRDFISQVCKIKEIKVKDVKGLEKELEVDITY